MKEKYYEDHGSPHLKSPTSPLPSILGKILQKIHMFSGGIQKDQ